MTLSVSSPNFSYQRAPDNQAQLYCHYVNSKKAFPQLLMLPWHSQKSLGNLDYYFRPHKRWDMNVNSLLGDVKT